MIHPVNITMKILLKLLFKENKNNRKRLICTGNASSALSSRKMAGALKQSTYITGLAVCQNPKNLLTRIYNRTLKLLLKMPENAMYRKSTQSIITNRLAIVSSASDIKEMEEKINCGQIEEVIQQARNELELAENLLLTRPWESLCAPIPKNQWQWPVK